MSRMTVKERIEDISSKSGMSEDIIRRVLNAERESIVESLKRGEKATLIGRCVIEPEFRQRLQPGGELGMVIKLSAKVSNSLKTEMEKIKSFENTEDDYIDEDGIMLLEISSLT